MSKFLIINTSEKLNPHFNCASRISFGSISSKKFKLEDFQGKLIFDLSKFQGDDIQKKTNKILSSLKFDLKLEQKRGNYEDVLLNANLNLKYAKKNINYFSQSFLNDMIVELHHSKPSCAFAKNLGADDSIQFVENEFVGI